MEIIKNPKDIWKYNPTKLPKALDFHLATKDLPLPRDAKTKIQLAISKMDRKQLKTLIDELGDMRYTALNHFKYKMAAYCEAVKKFVEEYFKSVKEQKRV